jgi:hypothetical protein
MNKTIRDTYIRLMRKSYASEESVIRIRVAIECYNYNKEKEFSPKMTALINKYASKYIDHELIRNLIED